MKKTNILLLIAGFVLMCSMTFAQIPQGIKYQAVVRDANGQNLQNKMINLRVSILKGSSEGECIYQETHKIQTDQFGLANLNIGQGEAVKGNFENLPWGDDRYFFQLEMSGNGNPEYQLLGTSELMAVPYALYAKKSENDVWNVSDRGIYYCGGNVGIGNPDPEAKLDLIAPAQFGGTQGQEILFDGKVKDAPGDFLRMYNGTIEDSQFIPCIWGHHETDDRISLGLIGSIKPENDFGDYPITVFDSRINLGNSSFAAVQNRPLFVWRSVYKVKMTMLANGNLGIGTENPARKLHIDDVMRLEPRAIPPDDPSEGDIYMDSTVHKLKVFDGTEWQSCW
jgi:hypothetical protein